MSTLTFMALPHLSMAGEWYSKWRESKGEKNKNKKIKWQKKYEKEIKNSINLKIKNITKIKKK